MIAPAASPAAIASLALLEAVALGVRAERIEGDIARMRAHLNDGNPAVRKHARDWLYQLEDERKVLCRWRSELPGQRLVCCPEPNAELLQVPAMICRGEHQ